MEHQTVHDQLPGQPSLDEGLARLEAFPGLDFNHLSLDELNTIEPGSTYRLPTRPSAAALQQSLGYQNAQAEIGIICLEGSWFATFGQPMGSERKGQATLGWPQEFRPFERAGMLQFDGHSHPKDSHLQHSPSALDVRMLGTALDGYQYIFTTAGLLEYDKPHRPANDTRLTEKQTEEILESAWNGWNDELLELHSVEELRAIGGIAIQAMFNKEFFGQRIIPWNNEAEIDQILHAKELLSRK